MVKLQLALKAEYFDAIKAGTKPEEYRLANDHWTRRLHHGSETWSLPRVFDGITPTKGYPKRGDPERTIELPWRGFVRKTITHPHFGPEPVEVFAIDVSSPSPSPRAMGINLTDDQRQAIMEVAARMDASPESVLKRAIGSYCAKFGGDGPIGEPDETNVVKFGEPE